MAEVATPSEVVASLRFLLELCQGGGQLQAAMGKEALKACELVGPFVRNLRGALDSPMYPADDVMLGCEKDRTPHAMRFHAHHTGEAP